MKRIIHHLLAFSTICLLTTLLAPATLLAQEVNTKDGLTHIERIKQSKASIPLNPDDPTLELWSAKRDTSKDPKRDPGPIELQRQVGGMAQVGIPTFFKQPVALNAEDLKAGKVDVAIMGAPLDMGSGRRGTGYGPMAFRTSEAYLPWGNFAGISSESTMVNPLADLSVVDYGDAPVDFLSTEKTIVAVYDLVKEIAETGTKPFIVGGDHSLMYPNVAALAAVHGKGKIGVIHFDAHIDAEPGGAGHYLTHGSPVRMLIEEGHIKGKNFIQIGMRGWLINPEMLEWMRTHEVRYHFMAEIVKNGWESVMKQALKEALDGTDKLFISFDLDSLDPAFAPGTGTPEPGGITPREIFPILRALGIQNEIVGMDVVEINPLVDSSFQATALVGQRAMREVLGGMALRKKGIKDVNYFHPELIDHAGKK
jgi:agmatinase